MADGDKLVAYEWDGSWSPKWAPHVTGRWTKRVANEDGLPEAQRIECSCSTCGGTYVAFCSTGAVRSHITRFGWVHIHKDVLDPEHLKGLHASKD